MFKTRFAANPFVDNFEFAFLGERLRLCTFLYVDRGLIKIETCDKHPLYKKGQRSCDIHHGSV